MLNRKDHKRYPCFLHYFLFYVTIIAYCSLTSCFGVRTELIPQSKGKFCELPLEDQGNYCKLLQMVKNDDEKEQLDQTIDRIKQLDVLASFIKQNLQIYSVYNKLLPLLTKGERSELEQKFAKCIDIDKIDNQINHKKELIDQYASGLKLIKDAPMPTQQRYIDLLELLPEDESVKFKNDIVHAGNLDKVSELIALKLPNAFKQLDDDTKENLSKLPDDARQKILGNLINANSTTALPPSYQEAMGSIPPPYEGATVTPPFDKGLDIKKLIEQKIQEQEEKKDEDIPQDSWGIKLPLQGEDRNDFLTLVAQFSLSDQKYLQALFNKADSDSIENISFVFYTRFNRNDRGQLISAIIYLYKGWPAITIKLCNNPKNLSSFEKFQLFCRTNNTQLQLLKNLDKYIQQLEACDHNYEQYKKTYCH